MTYAASMDIQSALTPATYITLTPWMPEARGAEVISKRERNVSVSNKLREEIKVIIQEKKKIYCDLRYEIKLHYIILGVP